MILHGSRSWASLTRYSYCIPVHSVMFAIHSVLGLPLQTNYLHAIFKTTPFSAFLCFFPLQWTLQQQPVDVVTSDHVTKVGSFFFLYCWNYVKLFVCQCKDFFICFLFPPGYFHHLQICPHFKRMQFCHISGGYCPHKNYITVRHISMETKLYKHMCGRHFYTDVKSV